MLLPTIAPGQEPSPTPTAAPETERIIVTGSNIPTPKEVGPEPVLRIGRDTIDKSGERTAEELIRDLTVAGANGVPTSNAATTFTPGASSISLRGFDASDTLTLIDAKKVMTALSKARHQRWGAHAHRVLRSAPRRMDKGSKTVL